MLPQKIDGQHGAIDPAADQDGHRGLSIGTHEESWARQRSRDRSGFPTVMRLILGRRQAAINPRGGRKRGRRHRDRARTRGPGSGQSTRRRRACFERAARAGLRESCRGSGRTGRPAPGRGEPGRGRSREGWVDRPRGLILQVELAVIDMLRVTGGGQGVGPMQGQQFVDARLGQHPLELRFAQFFRFSQILMKCNQPGNSFSLGVGQAERVTETIRDPGQPGRGCESKCGRCVGRVSGLPTS